MKMDAQHKPGELIGGQKLVDIPENIVESRYQLREGYEPHRRGSRSRHSNPLSRILSNTPTTLESFNGRSSASSIGSSQKLPHSPESSLNSRISRYGGVGNKHDLTRPATPSDLLRRQSYASTSTAVTARTSFDEIELVREPQYRDSEIYHHYMALAVSDNLPAESVRSFRSLERHSLVVHEGEPRRLDKGKMPEQPPAMHMSRRQTTGTVESVDDARRAKHERSERRSYSGPLAHAEFDRMKQEIESLKKSVHDNKKIVKKQTKVGHSLNNSFTSSLTF